MAGLTKSLALFLNVALFSLLTALMLLDKQAELGV